VLRRTLRGRGVIAAAAEFFSGIFKIFKKKIEKN
jgi:hypothetical protein